MNLVCALLGVWCSAGTPLPESDQYRPINRADIECIPPDKVKIHFGYYLTEEDVSGQLQKWCGFRVRVFDGGGSLFLHKDKTATDIKSGNAK